jgi:hypothetical protein
MDSFFGSGHRDSTPCPPLGPFERRPERVSSAPPTSRAARPLMAARSRRPVLARLAELDRTPSSRSCRTVNPRSRHGANRRASRCRAGRAGRDRRPARGGRSASTKPQVGTSGAESPIRRVDLATERERAGENAGLARSSEVVVLLEEDEAARYEGPMDGGLPLEGAARSKGSRGNRAHAASA